MWGEEIAKVFETAVGGIEAPSPRLTVRRSTVRPPLPTAEWSLSFTNVCVTAVSVTRHVVDGSTLVFCTLVFFRCSVF